jgi:hypothetical protein
MNDNEHKKLTLGTWIGKIVSYLRERGLEVDPLPDIILDDSPNSDDDLFIKTGYYDPNDNKLVLFIDNRHIKDILRTFCHEMVHRNQNLVDPEGFASNASDLPLEQDPNLKRLESEAFLNGNLLFRGFTEQYTHGSSNVDELMNENSTDRCQVVVDYCLSDEYGEEKDGTFNVELYSCGDMDAIKGKILSEFNHRFPFVGVKCDNIVFNAYVDLVSKSAPVFLVGGTYENG